MSIYFYTAFIIEKLNHSPALVNYYWFKGPVEMPIAQVLTNQRACSGPIQPLPFAWNYLWCRGQDLNLRTITDWDLIPAPLTKLGDPCSNLPTLRAYIKRCDDNNKT